MRFPEGNLIVLYANNSRHFNGGDTQIPEHIYQRMITCINVYHRIINSKPDKLITEIIIISNHENLANNILNNLVAKEQIKRSVITIILDKSTLTNALENILWKVRERKNPPTTYVVTSQWQRQIYDNISIKFKDLKIYFEGALDHRPEGELDFERDREFPPKGFAYYKGKTKNKALDLLLNLIFSDKEKSQ